MLLQNPFSRVSPLYSSFYPSNYGYQPPLKNLRHHVSNNRENLYHNQNVYRCSRLHCPHNGIVLCPLCKQSKPETDCLRWCSQACFNACWSSHRLEHEQNVSSACNTTNACTSSNTETVANPPKSKSPSFTTGEAAAMIQTWYRAAIVRKSGILHGLKQLRSICQDLYKIISEKEVVLSIDLKTSRFVLENGVPVELASYCESLSQLLERVDCTTLNTVNESLRTLFRTVRKALIALIQTELEIGDTRKKTMLIN